MKNILIASVIIIASASASIAGTTTNRITTGTETGKRNVTVDNVRVETGNYVNETTNLKLDAVGESARANFKFEHGQFSGSASASNIEMPDPFVNGSFVETSEQAQFTDITKTNVIENVDFNNSFIEYRLDGSGI